MSPYELIGHTADVAVRAESDSLPGIFQETARALFEIMCDTSTLDSSISFDVTVEAETMKDLLHDWLSELLYLHETEDVLLCGYDVKIEGSTVKAQVTGEKTDPEKHVLRSGVKAITYHLLSVQESNGIWNAEVLFDV